MNEFFIVVVAVIGVAFIYALSINSNFRKGRAAKKEASKLIACPDCSSTLWIEGPGGGSPGNIECGKCHHRFNNLGPFGLQRISDGK